MFNLKDKVAVVTGASKGIGAAIAKRLSEAGAAVVVNYASGKEDADRVVGDIKANGGKAIAVKGDVAKAADMQRLFAETKKVFNRLDVLVNNAGVYKFLPLEEITDDEFHREFNINVLGTLLATKEAVKYFGPNGGSVINMSSIASAGEADASIYSGTKGAVDAITRGLAAELGPRKIRVNAIAPGGVETEGTHSAGVIGSDFEKAMIAGTPLGRIGQRRAVFDRDVLALDETCPLQALAESGYAARRVSERRAAEKADYRHRLLRPRRERPSDCRAAERG
jgi:3-oxoacyl-[acyl-carrier protein] reductase